ncbi:MAG: hypothetical protein AAGK17_03865 [Pseudomonadota bacterium]
MALMVLILLGLVLGWLSSILARTESAGRVWTQIALALLASLIVGIYANDLTVMGGITPAALGLACGASFAVLALYHLVAGRSGDKA